jgi:molybdopterin synthase catalytic subunit
MTAGEVALAEIGTDPIDEAAVRRAVASAANGALVTFFGVVRNHDDGRRVTFLEYSAHPDSVRFLRETCDRVAAQTGLTVAAAHRTGVLHIGDVALVACVASAHRAEAFKACGMLVDAIKLEVPIWKRQYFEDGQSEWVGL